MKSLPSLREAPKARLFFGTFVNDLGWFSWIEEQLTTHFGPLDKKLESPTYPFPQTHTYSKTMGEPLFRKFFFLKSHFPQDGLAPIKIESISIEEEAKSSPEATVDRPINIDPGLLNDCRIILASTKDYSHRIYRNSGIYEEITLQFAKGKYQALPWTYPDFKAPTYHEYFAGIRKAHIEHLNSLN